MYLFNTLHGKRFDGCFDFCAFLWWWCFLTYQLRELLVSGHLLYLLLYYVPITVNHSHFLGLQLGVVSNLFVLQYIFSRRR